MEEIIAVISILVLIGLIYGVVEFDTKTYSYKFLLVIISIWSFFVFYFLFFTKQLFPFKNLFIEIFAIINIILPLFLLLKPKTFYITKSPKILISLILIWTFTILSGLLLLSTYGGIYLLVTQPLIYILCVYEMRKNDQKIIVPIFLNIFMTFIFVFYLASWIFTH